MTAHSVDFHPTLRMSDRFAAIAAWSVAIGLCATVGWMALRPTDPEGAVTLLTHASPAIVVVQMVAISLVVAAVATVLVGRKLTDAGVFAACLGIAVTNLRGGTVASVLLGAVEDTAAVRRQIATHFIGETLVWFGLVLAAMAVSITVLRWCYGRQEAPGSAIAMMSGGYLPFLAGDEPPAPSGAPPERGLLHTAAVAAAAFVLIRVLATGSPARAIAHGQVYFSIAAAFCAAGYFLQAYFPTRTPLWTCLSVPMTAVMGYVWSMATDRDPGLSPASIPASPFLRALPIEYVTMGTLGSILSFWWTRSHYALRMVAKKAKGPAR